MQALKSLFSRKQVQVVEAVPARQPAELSPESLKLVGGGLPRVGGGGDTSGSRVADPDSLPRVG